MKLIDILVQELPKLGGWADGVYCIEQSSEGRLFDVADMDKDYLFNCHEFDLSDDWNESSITRKQYEDALADRKAKWDGEGMPPVGCECEFNAHERGWEKCSVLYASKYTVLLRTARDGDPEEAFTPEDLKFRPIRSEADKKRTEAIHIIADLCRDSASNGHSGQLVYDAIAAGKVPGIRIE